MLSRIISSSHRLAVLAAIVTMLTALVPARLAAQATPTASPVATTGCEGLPSYFAELAGLTLEHEGLVLLRGTGYDALALTANEAATVVASLDALIPQLEAMTPPAPAVAYHGAYLEMMAWYRALAAYRDAASHQRLINDDRRLFGLMGLAIQSGQAECGYEAWNSARDAAFALEE